MNNDNFQKEEEFHDQWANSVDLDDVMVDEFFEACTSPENRLILKKLGDVKGKKILELGAGLGEASVYFAKKGALVTATDISGGMLRLIEKLAEKHCVGLMTKQCYSQELPFGDDMFDIVYAANLLHHVDIEQTLVEARRVLHPGGIFVSWDPLAHNPLINVYRRMASSVRTEDEHPLRMSDLVLFKKHFSSFEYDVTWLTTLWIFIKFYFIDKVDPNKERYWKKILVEHRALQPIYTKLEKNDRIVLRVFPFLKRYCWNIIIFAKK